MSPSPLKQRLQQHPDRLRLVQHPFFDHLQTAAVTRELAARFVGQWWHPLHYFPTFLSNTIAASRSLAVKTATSRILFQELGEGDPSRAHENIYITTMQGAGFTPRQIVDAPPLPSTAALVRGYDESSRDPFTGIGFLYATEVADLAMVSGIGTAVRRAVGAERLPWVDIHVQQEPAHVHEADTTVDADLDEAQTGVVIRTAEQAWTLWVGFFDSLYELADRTS